MERLRRWVKSVLPPEDKFVGWIDMSNPAAPIKKVCTDGAWITVGQLSYDEGYNEAIAIVEKYTISNTPIGVIKQTVDTTDGYEITLGEYTALASFKIENTVTTDSYLFVYKTSPSLTNFAELTNTSGVVSTKVIASTAQSNYEARLIEDVGYVIVLKTATFAEEDTEEE